MNIFTKNQLILISIIILLSIYFWVNYVLWMFVALILAFIFNFVIHSKNIREV